MKLSALHESAELQQKGSPLEIMGMKFFIRRYNYQFEDYIVEVKRKKFGVFYSDHGLSNEEKQLALAIGIAEFLCTGFENVINDETGDEVVHSLSTAKEIFCNPAYFTSLNLIILSHANNFENYLSEILEKDKEEVKKR